MKSALLFDLDDTLVVEKPAAEAAFLATARVAADRRGIDATLLAKAARTHARILWWASPSHPYCKRIGISSWEGLWCRYEGDAVDLAWLRGWAPTYRREAWRLGLADQGVADEDLAAELGERFCAERRARYETYPDAARTLAALSRDYDVALVTNGASCLQREKLDASGLAQFFSAVVVAGDVGAAKPYPAIYRRALELLGQPPGRAVMVGDTLERDIAGALALGIGAVWLNRDGSPTTENTCGVSEVATLDELPKALADGVNGGGQRRTRAVTPSGRVG